MNKQLVDHWIEQFDLDSSEADLLESFSVLMDRNSLFLMEGKSSDGKIEFIYTDEAVHFKFSLTNMKKLMERLNTGESLDWEQINEEYTIPRQT